MGENSAKKEVWPQVFQLNMPERYWLLNLLPQQGKLDNLKVIRELREDLGPTDEEREMFNIQGHPDGRVTWNDAGKEIFRDIKFGKVAFDITKQTLIKLEQTEKLHLDCMVLYEKFVTGFKPEFTTKSLESV